MTGKSEEKVKKDDKSKKAEAEEQVDPRIAELEAELAKVQEESASRLALAQRTLADFDNYRKRTEKENAEYKKFATSGLVSELLNISDDLQKALESADPDSSLTVGVSAIRGNLVKILESQGVTEVSADNGFDPNTMEALCVIEGEEDGKVAQIYQKGYMMNGRVLRTAKVVVTKKKEQEAAPEQDEKTAEKEN